jgi:hypothetical protein
MAGLAGRAIMTRVRERPRPPYVCLDEDWLWGARPAGPLSLPSRLPYTCRLRFVARCFRGHIPPPPHPLHQAIAQHP